MLPSTAEALRLHAASQETDVHALYRLAEGLRQVGRLEDASSVQARAVELDPGHPGARRQWAELLLALGRIDEATAQANEALALHDIAAHRVLTAYVAHLRGGSPAPGPEDLGQLDEPTLARFRQLPRFGDFAAALQPKG